MVFVGRFAMSNQGDGSYTGADLFVDALQQYGVTHVFGNPGTTELPVVMAAVESDLRYILTLHEDIAVGMAGGYASTRRYHADRDPTISPVGVANLHIGPGTAHGLGNLFAAYWAGAPIVLTAGNQNLNFRHEDAVLYADLVQLTDQFTKWSDEVYDVSALPTMLRRAFRVALTPPTGPVFLELPMDVMMAETDARPERLGPIPDAGDGDSSAIARAVDHLVAADDVVLVVGDDVARSGTRAVDSAVSLAEATGARVHAEIHASEISFPTDHDQWGAFLPPIDDIVRASFDADVVLFVGCSSMVTYAKPDEPLVSPDVTCIQIGSNRWDLGKNVPAETTIIGDPGRIVSAITDGVRHRLPVDERDRRLAAVQNEIGDIRSTISEFSAPLGDGPGVSKRELAEAISNVAPDAYIVDEGVTAKYALLEQYEFEPEQFISNKSAGLGYGLPAAVGAAMAEREQSKPRETIAFIGDGSYLFYPQTLYTAARYDVDMTVVVPDNRGYSVLKLNVLDLFGGSEDEYDFGPYLDLDPMVDIAGNAETHGARGTFLADPDQRDVESALAEALERSGPDVIDVLIHD